MQVSLTITDTDNSIKNKNVVRTFVQVFGVKFLQQSLNFNPQSVHVHTFGPRMWNLSVLHGSETREPI